MQLSESTNNTGIMEAARWWTDTNTITYTDNDLKRNINKWYLELANEALLSMDSWDFQGEVATTDLVASQQDYSFPTDILKIKRMEVTYDGTNWYRVTPMDIQQIDTSISTTANISNDFNTDEPFYDLHADSIYLFPVPTANRTAGLKIWYEKNVTELSSTTDVPALHTSFHKLLAIGAAYDYFLKKGMPAADRMLQHIEIGKVKMREFYNTRSQDHKYVFTPKYQNLR